LFDLILDWDTYTKLINAGMKYVNWTAVTNIYRDSKNYEHPYIKGSFYGRFTNQNTKKSVGQWNYINSDWILVGSSSRVTWCTMYTSLYTSAYGTDNTTSGKYEIKSAYDKFNGFGATWCNVDFGVLIDTTEPGDGFRGSYGKAWFKSFNLWFSKS